MLVLPPRSDQRSRSRSHRSMIASTPRFLRQQALGHPSSTWVLHDPRSLNALLFHILTCLPPRYSSLLSLCPLLSKATLFRNDLSAWTLLFLLAKATSPLCGLVLGPNREMAHPPLRDLALASGLNFQ